MAKAPFDLNQKARIRSVKSDDRYRSLDAHTSKVSSLQQDDGGFPSYIQLYKSMIVKCVECSHLLPRLRDIFDDQGERRKIENKSKYDGPEAGMKMFLENLGRKVNHPDRWYRFVDALKDADFLYVAKALEKQEIIDKEIYTTQRRLIDVFACELYKKLKPSEIIVDLFSKQVLNKEMLEAVKLEEQNKGESSATIVLIDNIWRCNENWYTLFLEVLCKHEHKDSVMEIDPSFLEASEMKNQEGYENSSDFLEITENSNFKNQIGGFQTTYSLSQQAIHVYRIELIFLNRKNNNPGKFAFTLECILNINPTFTLTNCNYIQWA